MKAKLPTPRTTLALREKTVSCMRHTGNGMGDAGAQCVAAALSKNKSLCVLDCRYNNVAGAAAQTLADAAADGGRLWRFNGVRCAAATETKQPALDLTDRCMGPAGVMVIHPPCAI